MPIRQSAIVDGNVFLQGSRLSIGIGATGSFGTVMNAPAGFFTDTSHGFSNLGIYADLDGFGRGVLPTFRDATVPGTPEERFNVGYRPAEGASPIILTNSDLVPGAGTALPASSVEDLSSGSTLSARWTGQDGNGLRVSQVVSFDAADTYLKVTITLTNTSSQAMHDVRYMRNVDPDQAPGFTTANHIFEQNPGGVLAAAYVPGGGGSGTPEGTSPFFYYSRDPRAVVANFGFTNTDPYAPEVTTAIQPEGKTSTTDSALAIAFNVGTLAAGASTSLTFYLGVAADLDQVVGSIVPEIAVLTLDIDPTGTIYRDTQADDTFAPLTGSLSSNGADPEYVAVNSVPSRSLPGYDQKVVGTYGILYLNGSTGAYTYVPGDSAIEGLNSRVIETFEVTVTDGNETASGEIDIDLRGVDDRPTLTASATSARFADTREDDIFAPLAGQLIGEDRDAGDSLVFNIVGGIRTGAGSQEVAKAGRYGTLVLDTQTGAYFYEPDEDAIQGLRSTVRETFTLTVTDAGGFTTTETFTVTLAGVNDAPEISASILTASYLDTAGDDAFALARGRLTGADRDLGDALSFAIAGGSASSARTGFDIAKAGVYGTLFLNSETGGYLFVPSDRAVEGLHGSASETFTLLVRDESGAMASETFTIDLAGANDRPEGGDDAYSVDEGGMLRVARLSGVLRNDSDRDDAVDAVLVNAPRHGTLTLNPDGSFTYRPDAGFSGTDSFTYRASDGSLDSAPTRVTIEVEPDGEPDNRPPVASDDGVAVAENRTSLADRVVTGNVLANDSDPDAGDTLHVTALAGEALGTERVLEGRYGTLTLSADGSYSYAFSNTDALIAGESGTERFAYTVADGEGRTDTAILTFTIDGADLKLTTSGTFVAHRGSDQITGRSGADRLAGRQGGDLLEGELGDDMLWGEEGSDRLSGGAGNDLGVGGLGDDTIGLGDGDDRGWGEAGNDALRGEDGNDRLDGGIGDDTLDLGFGDDRGWGSLGTDSIVGGAGADWLNGGAGNDTLSGGTGDDELWGGSENDVLDGGLDDDRMSAGLGNDLIVMGAGDDIAWGGAGGDRFAFSGAFGNDVVKDLSAGDRIVFDGVFANFAAVQSAMRTDGGNIVIDGPNGHTVTIENVARLDAGDFSFV